MYRYNDSDVSVSVKLVGVMCCISGRGRLRTICAQRRQRCLTWVSDALARKYSSEVLTPAIVIVATGTGQSMSVLSAHHWLATDSEECGILMRNNKEMDTRPFILNFPSNMS